MKKKKENVFDFTLFSLKRRLQDVFALLFFFKNKTFIQINSPLKDYAELTLESSIKLFVHDEGSSH